MHQNGTKVSRIAGVGLSLGALGVVFGDIGTSPLYTMKVCLTYMPEVERLSGVLGILSLMFWTMMLVVSIKYVTFIMKAGNRGEGGIFALLALTHTKDSATATKRGIGIATIIVLAGAALLYGDGVITPAITVLSAAESFTYISPVYGPYVTTIACVILGGLFWLQHKGTMTIGWLFGPVMLVWFVVLGALGLWHLLREPAVLWAVNPVYGFNLLVQHPEQATALLGAIVLTVTGTEALYADMGHFGRRHITRAWYFIVFPGLLLNYFGQGAYVFLHPADTENPFYALAPDGPFKLGLILFSIVAAVIASQALITGTYSLTRQAIQLGYFPRLMITHTHAEHEGQIYVPLINQLLAVCCIAVVLGFHSSSNLAAAYGIAVTGTMAVTTLAFYRVARERWHWSFLQAAPLCAVFLTVDLAFFIANLHKFVDGGWLPIAIGLVLLAIMHTWKTGKNEIFRRIYANEITEDELCVIARSEHVTRVRGTAVFMAGNPSGTPLVLLHHVKANKVLHETVVLLSILTDKVPFVRQEDRLQVREIGSGIWRATAHYGYMESPDVSAQIERIRDAGVPLKPQGATYYFNREMIMAGGGARMWEWQKHLYAFLSRNARQARDYYRLPPMQIVELGLPIQL
ncbi:MAG: KUP/HAK/KT family potassium transporter [Opitutaceae bacterium]|nr:KUP/HAK/KT family potassium transporter [Opitutaceae bacterium]